MELWKSKKLTEAEKDIMMVLWDSEQPLRASEIVHRLEADGSRKWKTQTAHVLLKRLAEKELVSVNAEGYTHDFAPLVSKEAYAAAMSAGLMQEMGQHGRPKRSAGSLATLVVASLIDTEELSERDIDALTRLLAEKKAALADAKPAAEKEDSHEDT